MHAYSILDDIPLVSLQKMKDQLHSRSVQFTVKQIGDSIHLKSVNSGFEVEYEQDSSKPQGHFCQAVFLYIHNIKMKQYQCYLPYQLSHKMPIKVIFFLLGEPTSKSKYMIECEWEHLGISITFQGMGWADESCKIDYICLFAIKNPAQTKCAVCPNKMKKGNSESPHSVKSCANCPIIAYCSSECENKFSKFHSVYCQQID